MPDRVTITEHTVHSQGLALNVLETGNPQGAPLLLVHGLRDTAHALLPMAQRYFREYRVLALEHRGHGGSDATDGFSMPGFVLDVHDVCEALINGPLHLFGHSLGGHIACKYAALFPERVSSLIVAEGLGPPDIAHAHMSGTGLQMYRERMLAILPKRPPRVMQTLDEVAGRLLNNNPRLPEAEGQRLATHLSRPVDGGYVWAFDPRAQSVFVGLPEGEPRQFWAAVQAPTLVISGRQSYEYWARDAENPDSGRFAPGEMEARCALFPQAQHAWLDQAGHMLHYDQPDRLGELCRRFLLTQSGQNEPME